MEYTVKQVAEITGLTGHTIRYYDREGLLPTVQRTAKQIRKFSETDIEWIRLICCLKNSGMSVKEIKSFMNLCLDGSKTAEDRKRILEAHREHILMQMKELENSLCIINYKIEHYKEIGVFHIDGK